MTFYIKFKSLALNVSGFRVSPKDHHDVNEEVKASGSLWEERLALHWCEGKYKAGCWELLLGHARLTGVARSLCFVTQEFVRFLLLA